MILFCEYSVPDTYRKAFLEWAYEHADLWRNAEWLENTEQPGVFVEIWRVRDKDEANRIKKERLDERSGWREMDGWVKGGLNGLRLWTFTDVRKE
jgi:hypothetical protein